jgi:hypothetical protein
MSTDDFEKLDNTTIEDIVIKSCFKRAEIGSKIFPLLSPDLFFDKDTQTVVNDLRVNTSKISYAHYSGSWLNEYGTSTVADGSWHYLTWVNYSNKTMDMYVDGKKEASGVSSAQSSGPVNQIGRNWYRTFNGSIDQVQIYNYAKNQAQVAWDYNRGKPVGWWKMDEGEGTTVYDWSGNANNGTLTNMDATTDWVDGKINKALDFDGSDDYVTITNNFTSGLSGITISAWVKSNQLASSNIFRSTSSSSIILHYNGGGFYLVASDDTASGYLGWDNALPYNEWVHVAATWSSSLVGGGDDKMKLFVNGKQQSSELFFSGGVSGKLRSSAYLHLGNYFNASQPYFSGQIDDARIYNYALTSQQIKDLYNGGAVKFGN